MTDTSLVSLLNQAPDFSDPWGENHKIPWNDPAFSRRMLREHLTQDHELASRSRVRIAAQVRWLHERALGAQPGHVLDLGCGPGLYASGLADAGHAYTGLDFGPASIKYAEAHFRRPGQVRFRLGDVRELDFGSGHDLACMLFGELNVFSPEDCRAIVRKAYHALNPGGVLLVEVHSPDAVRDSGRGESWQACESGLFSDSPYLCLTRNHWSESLRVARQTFHVIEIGTRALSTHHSTMQAYSRREYDDLLINAGFHDPRLRESWPGGHAGLWLLSAVR
ncbi:class I SAM-dependent methyltransferase [Pseudodesulfovibrio tunisiensis]|uniref:class I SAM-dependent methyltransferase n=1 Tax=Pseudodesulfovibrio tunisiensis TaxID=463192 RepID=UPI001FB495A9|nr:class I SAM-dependent methyltransferase [Pseudodesulfovibrio tunisiensis]